MQASVGAFIMNDEGKILIQDHVKINGLTIPSGKLEDGETSIDALNRELFEELGVGCTIIDSMTFEAEYKETGTCLHYLFRVDLDGTPVNKEPLTHRSLSWMSVHEILNHKLPVSLYLEKVLLTLCVRPTNVKND